ncbi:MAG: RibD family protein [Gaiellaceae bacterium]
MPPLEPLYEIPELPEFELPEGLAEAYGGALGFSEPRLYANFVASLDGVVALPGEIQSNRMISGHSEADRFVMGLLRSCADAVLVGAGTMRSSPRTLWTAEHAYPPAARLFGELRRSRRRSPQPTLAVLSGSGSVDPRHPALEEGALVLTSEHGAARLRGRLPRGATILAIGAEAPLDPVAAVEALRQRGHELILSEGGPIAFGALVAAGIVDELFLTTSPLLAGRSLGNSRPSLVENAEFLPATTVEWTLLTLRRAGSQLFIRYQLSRPERRASTAVRVPRLRGSRPPQVSAGSPLPANGCHSGAGWGLARIDEHSLPGHPQGDHEGIV